MNKLRTFIIKKINRDVLDVYKYLDPTVQDFSIVVYQCQSFSADKKIKFSENLQKKFERQHTNKQILNLLIICDFLSATKPQLISIFPEKMQSYLQSKKKIRGKTKQQKIKLAQSNYIYFYLQYLKQKIWNIKIVDNFNVNNLSQSLSYCQSALNALKLVLRHDFIIQYALNNSEFKNQIKISLQNILRRSSEDLAILIRFTNQWCPVIVQESVHSVMVNDIYQQLIYVSKNIQKFQYMSNRIEQKIKFPRYEINKNLNTAIEKSMIGREGQKKSFYLQRRLKTDEDMFHQDHGQITQSQIIVKFKL